MEVGTLFRHVAVNVNRDTKGQQTPELSVLPARRFLSERPGKRHRCLKKMGPSPSTDTLRAFVSKFPSSSLVDAARARIDAIESASNREQLVREYTQREQQLRLELEEAEASFRKANEELSQLRQRDELRRIEQEKQLSSTAPGAAIAPGGAAEARCGGANPA